MPRKLNNFVVIFGVFFCNYKKLLFIFSYLEHKTMADTPKSWSLDLDVLWTFK